MAAGETTGARGVNFKVTFCAFAKPASAANECAAAAVTKAGGRVPSPKLLFSRAALRSSILAIVASVLEESVGSKELSVGGAMDDEPDTSDPSSALSSDPSSVPSFVPSSKPSSVPSSTPSVVPSAVLPVVPFVAVPSVEPSVLPSTELPATLLLSKLSNHIG